MSHTIARTLEQYFTTKLFSKYFNGFISDRSKSVGLLTKAPPIGLKFTKAISFVLKDLVMSSFVTT